MSIAQRVFHGRFGRVALLNMDRSLVTHTHSECHVLVKVSGEDTYFNVNGRRVPLSDRTAVLVTPGSRISTIRSRVPVPP